MDPQILMDAIAQVLRSPVDLASEQTALVFAMSMYPSEVSTDEEPPGWITRDDGWSIDNLLGCYESRLQRITIFNKGVEFIAQKLGIPELRLRHIVSIHEWAHAIFHLGVSQEKSFELAKAAQADDTNGRSITLAELTTAYEAVDPFVHEQIAQIITWLSLQAQLSKATREEAKRGCTSLCETFEALIRRQPRQYRLDNLRHLDPDHLQRRLRAMIGLIRNRRTCGDEKTWQTIMPQSW